MSNTNFKQAEQIFIDLFNHYNNNELSHRDLIDWLRDNMVLDSETNSWWCISYQTGEWYYWSLKPDSEDGVWLKRPNPEGSIGISVNAKELNNLDRQLMSELGLTEKQYRVFSKDYLAIDIDEYKKDIKRASTGNLSDDMDMVEGF